MIDLHQRKREATEKRLAELLALPGMVNSQQVRDILDRQFEAGVHAHSDHMEASRQMAMDKARRAFEKASRQMAMDKARRAFEIIHQHSPVKIQPEPVAFMGCEPGTMLTLLRKEGE